MRGDRSRSNGDDDAAAAGSRSLRQTHRPTAFGGGRRLLHHQGSLWWREGRQKSPRQGQTRHKTLHTVVDAKGIPLGAVAAPANRHDSPLLSETLDTLEVLVGGELPEQISVHLDSSGAMTLNSTREKLEDRRLLAVISEKGKPAPLQATKRWVVESTSSWHNAHKKLVWCTERRGRVVDFWVAFSEVVIIVRRLIREGWSRYR
jgi:hypothetical protein